MQLLSQDMRHWRSNRWNQTLSCRQK